MRGRDPVDRYGDPGDAGSGGPARRAGVPGADAEARMWSAAAPPVMPGIARWAKTNELLRLRLLARGWSLDNPGLMPPTTLGILRVWKRLLPGSTRSGEKHRKKSSPTFSPSFSKVGNKSSSVVPG